MSPPASSSTQLYLRLLSYVKPYWRVFAGSVVALTIVAATEPALPAIVKPLLDGGFVNKYNLLIRWAPFLIVGLMLVRGIASFAGDYASHWVKQRVVADLRQAMFDTLIRLPTQLYDLRTKGQMVSKFTFDVTQVTDSATNAVTILVRDTLTVLGLLGFLLWTNWKLTLITFVVAPIIAFVIRRFSGRLRAMSRAEIGAMGDLNHTLEEAIGGHRVVKVFDGQAYESGRLREVAEKVRRFSMKAQVAAAASVPLTQIIASIAVAIIVYLALAQSARDQTTVGGFVAFLGATLMMLAPVKRLTSVSQTLQRGLAAAEGVFSLIDDPREVDTGTREIGRSRGEIEFRNVSFGYSGAGRDAVSGISFRIAPGETLALVGASGSGKTTIANLIPRFYTPTSGEILLDGMDTREITLASLRANIALVSQDVVLFNDTVAANIAYGRLANVDPKAIVAAAEAASAMGFIGEMSEGLQTLVGENGVRLSGGQRQRLAIARAFLKDAPILILDEATSALDTESERQIQSALETLMRGRTTLVIAHRLSTVQNADRILVLERGRVVETGRHAELLAADGAYARLYRMQFRDEPEGGAAADESAERAAASG